MKKGARNERFWYPIETLQEWDHHPYKHRYTMPSPPIPPIRGRAALRTIVDALIDEEV